MPSLQKETMLTETQMRIVEDSFELIHKKVEEFTDDFYQKLLQLSPTCTNWLPLDGEEQQQVLLKVLTDGLKMAIHWHDLHTEIQQLSERSAQPKLKAEYFVLVGQSLLFSLEKHLATQFTEEVKKAWVAWYIQISSVLFEQSNPTMHQGEKNSSDFDLYLAQFVSHPKEKIISEPLSTQNTLEEVTVDLNYVGDRVVQGTSTKTILEISLANSIEHFHDCGAEAKCSTCRVIIEEGLENCSPRNEKEKKLAQEKGLSSQIRVACQTHVHGPVTLRRLVKDREDVQALYHTSSRNPAREKKLAILFADIRSFATFAEQHLPYDVVHMLNRYYNTLGIPIYENGGQINKYMGDGMMVLFGLQQESSINPSEQSIQAALEMLEALTQVNTYLQSSFQEQFKVGIGIDFGDVIVGEVGFNQKKEFTALGDTVNIASRIEELTKTYHSKIIVSSSVLSEIENETILSRKLDFVRVKGKEKPVSIYEIYNADPPEIRAKKQELDSPYHQGLYFYYQKEWEKALSMFEQCQQIYPEDQPTKIYIARCKEYREQEPMENWNQGIRL